MQVRRELGALLRADPLGALLGQPARSRSHHGARISVIAVTTTSTASVTSRSGTSAPLSQRKTSAAPTISAAPSATIAERRAREPQHAPRPPRSAARPGALARRRLDDRGALRLAPDQRAAAGREHERPHDGVADPHAPGAEQQQHGEHQQHEAGGDHPALAPADRARHQRPAVAPPAGISAQQIAYRITPVPPAPAAIDEADAQDQRIDAEPRAEPGADAAEHALERSRRSGAGCVSGASPRRMFPLG